MESPGATKSTSMYVSELRPDNQFAVNGIKIEHTCTGRRITLKLKGERFDLDMLAWSIQNGYLGETSGVEVGVSIGDLIPYIQDNEGMKELLSLNGQAGLDLTVALNPVLDWTGEGTMAELIVVCVDGLLEGSSFVAEDFNSERVSDGIPPNVTVRLSMEPEDVDLLYANPFRGASPDGRTRAGKWNLEQSLSTAGVFATMPAELSGYASENGINGDTQLNYIINLWMNGVFPDTITHNACAKWFMADSTKPWYEWMVRHLRGQRTYRTWVPHGTIVWRYRTMPDANNADICPPANAFGTMEVISSTQDTEDGPPLWSGFPIKDTYGNVYIYWRQASQVVFAGDCWAVETPYIGGLWVDTDLYSNPITPTTP